MLCWRSSIPGPFLRRTKLPPFFSRQALMPSMTEGFHVLISQRSMAAGPTMGPHPGGWASPPPAASSYTHPPAGGYYPQPPAGGPAGYAGTPGWQSAAPSYPSPCTPPASAYPPPAGWATGSPAATTPPAASPLQAGLTATTIDCSASTQAVSSAPPLPSKEPGLDPRFPAIV